MRSFSRLESNLKKLSLYANRDKIELTHEQEIVKEECEGSFHDFVRHAWPYVQGQSFKDGFHIEAITEHMEALYDLEIRDLLINLPPRCGKSLITSVFYPAWIWTIEPNISFLYTAYSSILSERDSRFCKRLIASEWYQSLWADKYKIMKDSNSVARFDNNKHGFRIASSVEGTITGQGADIICCFPYEVLITTNLGEIPIGRIVEENIDCQILSYNHDTQKVEHKPILEYMKRDASELIEIELEDGTLIECTLDHPIYVEGKGYVAAGELTEDNFLRFL